MFIHNCERFDMPMFSRLRAIFGRRRPGVSVIPVLPNLKDVDVCAKVIPTYMPDPSGLFAYDTGRRVQFTVLGFAYDIYTSTRFGCGTFTAVVSVRDGKLASFVVVATIEAPETEPPAVLGGASLGLPA